ncbi:hypothetical protein ABZ769_26920 [Streptomyces olivoreticuli]
MPTYEALPRFTTDLDRLTPEQRRRFHQVVTRAFVPDLRTGHFRAGLREARGFVDSTNPNSMNSHARRTLWSSSVRVLGVRVRGLLVVEFGADAA